ncbi:hypothetical protein JQ581_29930 [Bradyrhizobium liaoningense]|uniref:hypothetical protein n=1 Tax=Bradyrhizobium liaoningense TaxID=43992 RepID=UPI001BA6825C|nr:hypothetical protein [Bradyrhizobium liaoningense]MBR0741159.1 hypothetical protein [Bradyrhizobium liaoningense]
MAGFFDTLFGGGAEREAAEKNRALAAQYQTSALDYLKTGYGTGTDAINKGVAAYDPLAALGVKYSAAGDTWLNALGVNGADGSARATQAFQTTPGYELTQRAALDAIDRRRAIGGMYASGNADQDTANWITKNLYETQYQPWMSGLQSAAGMGGQYTAGAAQGQQQGYTSLADLARNYGLDQSNVANNYMGQNVSANNMQAAGEAAGAKNLLGAGLSLAGMAFGGGGGGMLSSLGGMFGGGGSTLNSSPWSFPMATAGGNWGRPQVSYG